MKCKKHPRYKAIFKPKCSCPECWDLYMDNNLKINHKKISLHSNDESTAMVAKLERQFHNCFLDLIYCQNNRSDAGRKKDVERWFAYEKQAEDFVKEIAMALTGREVFFDAGRKKGVFSPALEAKLDEQEVKGEALIEKIDELMKNFKR
jgi:hypothetical protein